MGQAVQDAMERLQPEAAYFYPEDGRRTALFVFDMESSSQLPPLTEPFFQMGADVRVAQVMDANDLRSGLDEIQSG